MQILHIDIRQYAKVLFDKFHFSNLLIYSSEIKKLNKVYLLTKYNI